jgi:hypothetical protein
MLTQQLQHLDYEKNILEQEKDRLAGENSQLTAER